MKFKSCLWVLLLMMGLAHCSPSGETNLSETKLNNQNYKIANSDELAQDLQQISSKVLSNKQIQNSSVSVFPVTQGAKPISVAFQADKKFKLTYSDGSFLVGLWEMEGNQLKLTFMGISALFGLEFPTEESIQLWIEKILDVEVEPVTPTNGIIL
ncbi:MAG: hypothetical protein HYU97_05710 [Deltaproteobacteria bacterium]|nr:hypothetical protein [Deltaproteobacteria bacterium]